MKNKLACQSFALTHDDFLHILSTFPGFANKRPEFYAFLDQVSERMGFKDRQILSNIESGSRKVSADELVSFLSIFKKPLEYFTDPYLLTDPEVFSWRAERESPELDIFEPKARNFVMAYRRFNDLLGEKRKTLSYRLTLSKRSSYEDAMARAEQFVEEHDIGEKPAWNLDEFVRNKLGFVILYVDAPQQISGAACHLADLSVILINRQDSLARRHFDLAHEIFHLLTWDAMPPERIDPYIEGGKKQSRVEQLANNFASALLMPQASLNKFWEKSAPSPDINERIKSVAHNYGVSGLAAYWRLRATKLLSDGDILQVSQDRLKNLEYLGSDSNLPRDERPPLFSSEFAELLHRVLDKGLVSVRKTAEILDTTVDGISSVLRDYGKEVPFDL